MATNPDPKKFAPSSDLVPVKVILSEHRPGSGSVMIMRDGSFRMIIRCGAVNFDMKAPLEQGGLTYAFGALINSLEVDFPLQVVSHSKRLDVDAYVRQYENRLLSENTPVAIRGLIEDHKDHFEQHVKANNLLQRELYVVVPWKTQTGPLQRSITDEIPMAGLFKTIMKQTEKRLSQDGENPTDLEISTARQQLDLRADQVCDRLEQMGIWADRLDEDQVRKLLYELYHPSLSERQRDPGWDSGGSLLGGFSSEAQPVRRRRIGSEQPIEPTNS